MDEMLCSKRTCKKRCVIKDAIRPSVVLGNQLNNAQLALAVYIYSVQKGPISICDFAPV